MSTMENSLLTPEVKAFVGVQSTEEIACDVVERGAVRRFVQASLDDDPLFHDIAAAGRHGGPVAPALFPASMFRRDFGSEDILLERALDPDFDGLVGSATQGLPPLPLPPTSLLNGGTEVEIFSYVRHGEQVKARSRYENIYEKAGKSGPILFVEIVTDYVNQAGTPLIRVRKTQIRRRI
ncbi:FAS1-like dehydratase domain-containing protein [Aquamicrobium terrae]|uniref:FAS1-like dehydratase domain-containing protein n=1 Tax=Aquamicrobium terrae TaxID=1324945 RepID=A0ABV2N7E5_9HYPH